MLDACVPPLVEGARVVVHAKPDFYLARGTLVLVRAEIRPVGLGELLARLERLKAMLAAEGLFEAGRKRPLPFLPRVVGLVCGRGSAAERDVLENARRRWPAVQFRVENVAVQGVYAVTEVTDALARLDRDPEVDVIVVARGGGSVEDLLPFSDEALVRAVAGCRTPVVSAIGHEQDAPAARPGRRRARLDPHRRRPPGRARRPRGDRPARPRPASGCTGRSGPWSAASSSGWTSLRSRPVLADPAAGLVAPREAEVRALVERSRRSLQHRLDRAADELVHTPARVRALSPRPPWSAGTPSSSGADGAVVRSPSAGRPRATGCGSGWPRASSPRPVD